MLQNIKGNFSLFNRLKNWLFNDNIKEEFCSNNDNKLSKIQIKSFNGLNKILVSHKDIKDVELQFPLHSPLRFDINNIEEEVRRLACIKHANFLFNRKRRKSKLIIYTGNSMLVPNIEYIISKDKYIEYHLFPFTIDCYNSFKYLEKKYNNVRLNDVEKSIIESFTLCRNDYDEIYNDPDSDRNYHKVVFLSNADKICILSSSIIWLRNIYICMPFNKFIIELLKHFFRYEFKIEIIENDYDYCFLKIEEQTKNYNCISIDDFLKRFNKK